MYTASAVNFQITPWLLRLSFGEVADQQNLTAGTPMATIFRVAVGLSWPLVKVLHDYLGWAIRAFEATEGPILVPKSIQARVAEAFAAAEEAIKQTTQAKG